MIDVVQRGEVLNKILSSFICERDTDIVDFLQNKAVKFEEINKSRTYLLFEQQQMENDLIENWTICAYFSLALKVLTVPSEYSNNKRKDIDGLNAKIHGNVINDFPCYLLGQFSRNDIYTHEELSGEDILQEVDRVLANAVNAVGGRILMIECRNDSNLIRSYREKGFNLVSTDMDDTIKMIQMIRKL